MVTYHATIRKEYQKSESKFFFKAPKNTEKPLPEILSSRIWGRFEIGVADEKTHGTP